MEINVKRKFFVTERVLQSGLEVMVKKKVYDLFKGTLLAGDRLVVLIVAPSFEERKGMDLANFRTARLLCCQCTGVYCRFRYFEVSWPECTNDITSYKQTKLRQWFTDGLIESEFHMVLDEAYGSIGGDQHLTPFTKHQFRTGRATNVAKYQNNDGIQ